MIILLTGPAGSGKTTLATRIAKNPDWVHIAEDDLWNAIGHAPHQLRDDRGQARVHAIARQRIDAAAQDGQHVVLEFLIYEDPPIRLVDYRQFIEQRRIPLAIRVLRPNIETILERQRVRGRSSERDRVARRRNAEHQLRCLHSSAMDAAWVIDSSSETAEQTYARHFAHLVAQEST